MRTSQTKLIGKHTYEVHQLQATPAFELFLDLVKMGGPALGPLMTQVGSAVASGKAVDFGSVDLASIDLEKTIQSICFGLDKTQIKSIAKTLSYATTIVGVGSLSDHYELHFSQAGVFQLLQWLVFAVMTQFSDFSEALQRTNAVQA